MNINRLLVLPVIALLLLALGCVPGAAAAAPSVEATACPLPTPNPGPAGSAIATTRIARSAIHLMQIDWTTSVPTIGRLEYGKTTNYGLITPWTTGMNTANGITVAQLEPYGTYHVRVWVKDAAGNESASGDIFVPLEFPVECGGEEDGWADF